MPLPDRPARSGPLPGSVMWYETTPLAPGLWRLTEPAVHPWFQANFYTLAGRDAVLQFDFGCGLAPLRPALPDLPPALPVIAVASHSHVDHIGGFHEFADRRGHAAEAAGFAGDEAVTLAALLRNEVPGPAFTRPPAPGFDLAGWRQPPAPLTAPLDEGDRIDLGDRRFTVLHLPGHSPGSIALFDEFDGLLLAGDAIYDDTLLDDIPGASVADYVTTMQRLAGYDCRLCLAGHGAPFDGPRLRQIARGYLASRGA